jgi:hypothetical protein
MTSHATDVSTQHRHPFTATEVATITVVAAAPLVMAALGLTGWVVAAFGPVAAAWIYRVNASRKNLSTVQVSIVDGYATVTTGAALGSSQANLAEIDTISARKVGSDDVLALTGPNGGVRIPMRAIRSDARLRTVVLDVATTLTRVDTDAHRLLDGLRNGAAAAPTL